MRIKIANGFLSTDQEDSPLGHPVFVLNGVVHEPSDTVDLGEAASDSTRSRLAADLVADEYESLVDKGERFSVLEYNLIAKFSGLPLVNLCSGE